MMCPHYCVAARSPYVSVVTFRDVEVFLNYNDMVRTRLSVVDADTVRRSGSSPSFLSAPNSSIIFCVVQFLLISDGSWGLAACREERTAERKATAIPPAVSFSWCHSVLCAVTSLGYHIC